MGVVCVVNYPLPPDKSGQQMVEILQKRIESLGGIRSLNFTVDCETYHAEQNLRHGSQRVVHVLHNSEQPATCFAVLDTGSCLVADSLFDLLMLKLKSFYSLKKNLRMESRGQRYTAGDFIIKIGSVVLGQNTSFKGILVEVEYLPCSVLKNCWSLMREFMRGFLGNVVDSPPSYLESKMDLIFKPSDSIQQYLEHFNNFRKVVAQTISVQS